MALSLTTRRLLRRKAVEILAQAKPKPTTKPYRPSNGTAGMLFEISQCGDCSKEDNCEHMLSAMLHDVEDKEYPPWVSDLNGDNPRCSDRVIIVRWKPTKKCFYGSGAAIADAESAGHNGPCAEGLVYDDAECICGEDSPKPKWLFDRTVASQALADKMKERRQWAGGEGNARFLVLTIWRYMGRADSEPLGGTGAFDHGASDDVENTVKLSLDLLEKAPLSFLLFALSELWDETQVYNGVRRLQRLVKRGEWP